MTYNRRDWVTGDKLNETNVDDWEGRIQSEFTSQDTRITTNTSNVSTHTALTTTAHGGIVASTSLRLLPGGGSAGQVLAKATGTDYDTTWSSLALPQLVSSLPGSPVDGQEIYFQADATNGVLWHLRYQSASGSTYKWEFVGGSSLFAEVATAQSTASTSFVDLTTVGPSITVPLAGDYEFLMAAAITQAGTGNAGIVGLKIGAAAVADSIQAVPGFAGVGNTAAHPILRRTVSAATTVVKLQYAVNANTGTFSARFLGVRPVRVG